MKHKICPKSGEMHRILRKDEINVANIEPKILGILKNHKKKPVTLNELAKKTGISPSLKNEFLGIISRLEDSGKIVGKNGRYSLAENLGLVPAEIVKVNATFGFARPMADGRDIFVPGRMLLGAMPGDLVLIKAKRSQGELPEGEVFKIIRESDKKFSGILRTDGGEYLVVPDHYVGFSIKLSTRGLPDGLKDGDKILARLAVRGERHSGHLAELISSFGDSSKAAACCASILAANDIPVEFPLEVLEQARAIGAGEGIHPKELASRLDLRDETIFTIDGADTKDIDDAISLRKTERGWELGVHIADVSHYVTYKTPLDAEAFARGTSVYYADSVVPMLPKELSNGICSLNPNEDRLAFSAIIKLGADAKIDSYEFKKTVIRSRVKGVYSEINKILDGSATSDILEKYAGLTDMLAEMGELAKILTKNRFNRGGIDFDSTEGKIIVGADGEALDIVLRERGESELIIEEFMLVANECAARLAAKENLPFLYRVHERPAPDKLVILFDTLEALGVRFKRPKGGVNQEDLARILNEVRGTEIEEIVSSLMLRSMAKAKYSERGTGHFGLALDDYTHFTSPIRRYPDLTIHRVLSAFVTGMRRDNINKRFGTFAAQSASRSTERELCALSAERACEDAYKAEYMSKHIGEEFDGVISSVTQFGCYIRLANTVEGLLRAGSLSGDWAFDGSIALVDLVSGKKLRLADRIRVKVTAADVSAGHVDFEFVNTAPHKREY